MIDLITGLPGNAKTLYTIGMVKKWAEKDNRPVFYSGIPELTLDWQEIDPTKWMDCPPRSIVIIDECQKIFRNRSLGAQPPKHVTDLETHRHLGIDLVFITQHPSLVDPAIRKLTQRHLHLVRAFGMQVSTVHQWDAVRDNCDKPASRKDSIKTRWGFDKSLFGLYKSAEEHTFKRTIPLRVKLMVLLPLVLAGMAYTVYKMVDPRRHKSAEAVSSSAPGQTSAGVSGVPVSVAPVKPEFDPVADAKKFFYVQTPRIAGLAYTAPKYDKLTEPTKVPFPSACIKRTAHDEGHSVTCKCYSQQGTPLDVKLDMCVQFAENGVFQEFDPDGSSKAPDRGRPLESLAKVAVSGGIP